MTPGGSGNADEDADRQTASLAAAVLTLLLIVLGLFVVLHAEAVLMDCLLSGRANCNALVAHTAGDPKVWPRLEAIKALAFAVAMTPVRSVGGWCCSTPRIYIY